MSADPERERRSYDDEELDADPLEAAHARADALALRISELEARIEERRRTVAALASSPERSPMARHRERVRLLEAALVKARADRDAARRALPPGSGALALPGLVLGLVLLGLLWWISGGLGR